MAHVFIVALQYILSNEGTHKDKSPPHTPQTPAQTQTPTQAQTQAFAGWRTLGQMTRSLNGDSAVMRCEDTNINDVARPTPTFTAQRASPAYEVALI